MNRLAVCCISILLLLSCGGRPNQRDTNPTWKQKAEYDALAQQMVQSVAYIGEPLKDLNDEQLAAVAALVVMTRVVAQSEGAEAISSSSLVEGFWAEIVEICPPMPKRIQRELGGCFDEELAYAQSMSRCLDEGKTEEECEREAAGELSAAVMCRMEQIEELKGFIWRIPGRRWPPGPFPWPVETGPE